MVGRRRQQQQRLRKYLRRLNGYIFRIAQNTGWKSILFSAEDIVQECTVVLWRVIAKYPNAKGVKLIKLFKRSLMNHLAGIFRSEHVRRSIRTAQMSQSEKTSDHWNLEQHFKWSYEVLPWDYYESKLRMLEKRIGRNTLKSFLGKRNFNRSGFESRKEVLLKNID